tara:strand:+ start:334 stop:552 length:219 start_codon:yes stop_codon:yes gene_type:complete
MKFPNWLKALFDYATDAHKCKPEWLGNFLVNGDGWPDAKGDMRFDRHGLYQCTICGKITIGRIRQIVKSPSN